MTVLEAIQAFTRGELREGERVSLTGVLVAMDSEHPTTPGTTWISQYDDPTRDMDRSQAILVDDDVALLFATPVAKGHWLLGDPGGPMFEYHVQAYGCINASEIEPFPLSLTRIEYAKLTDRWGETHISPISERKTGQ